MFVNLLYLFLKICIFLEILIIPFSTLYSTLNDENNI